MGHFVKDIVDYSLLISFCQVLINSTDCMVVDSICDFTPEYLTIQILNIRCY